MSEELEPDDPAPRAATVTRDHRLMTIQVLHESDRGCVLSLGAHLDSTLESVLRKYFGDQGSTKTANDMFSGYGPLASFRGKIDLAYCLGLLGDELFKRLTAFRRMRNDFAHSKDWLTLWDPPCSDRFAVILADANEGKILDEYRTKRGTASDQNPFLENPAAARRFVLTLVISEWMGRLKGAVDGRLEVLGMLAKLRG